MPNRKELELLISSNVTYSFTFDYNHTGVGGAVITGKGDFSSASLFLPAAGSCMGTYANLGDSDGNYWARSAAIGRRCRH